jgi:hypothetical protein
MPVNKQGVVLTNNKISIGSKKFVFDENNFLFLNEENNQ